jgi:3-oxoacyl-[acyl-carrier-protein] synthase-3
MRYSKVYIDSIGYELPPIVVTSEDLEQRLKPLFKALRIAEGQLTALTGIMERRWWASGYKITDGAVAAARRALETSGVSASDVEVLIYGGVCREQFEPATACGVAAGLGVSQNAAIYDVSNACLGVLNGIIDIANRIELGQIRAGLVVSCETAREINEITIQKLLEENDMNSFTTSLATLTGGSGAVAVLLTDGSFGTERAHRLLGGVTYAAPEYHALCRWGMKPANLALNVFSQFMSTDAVNVLKFGVELGFRTFHLFLKELGWARDHIDKVICHQVGASHRDAILKTLGIPSEKDFPTYQFLGNIGTVSLPITAALADEREFLKKGDRVGFLGIGSGLNCLMLGVEW